MAQYKNLLYEPLPESQQLKIPEKNHRTFRDKIAIHMCRLKQNVSMLIELLEVERQTSDRIR